MAEFFLPIDGGSCVAIRLESSAFCDDVAWFIPFVVIIIKLYNKADMGILATQCDK